MTQQIEIDDRTCQELVAIGRLVRNRVCDIIGKGHDIDDPTPQAAINMLLGYAAAHDDEIRKIVYPEGE